MNSAAPSFGINRIAIAQFRRDIGFDRQAARASRTSICRRGRHRTPCRRRRSVSRDALASASVRPSSRNAHAGPDGIEIMRERMADDFGLLVDFLRHEMAVAALVDEAGGRAGDLDLAIGGAALGVEDRDVGPAQHGDVAVFEIGDAIGERRERERVGAEIGFVSRHSRPPAGCPCARR